MDPKRAHMQATPPSSDDENLDVLGAVFDELTIPSHIDIEPAVESHLRKETERLNMGQSGHKLVFANTGGHRFSEELESMREEMAALKSKVPQFKRDNQEFEEKLLTHRSEIKRLKKTSEGYRVARRRFWECYVPTGPQERQNATE